MRGFLKALPLGLGLPVVIGAASVKPEDAASNLAAWAKLFGVEDIPAWLSNPAIDQRVVVGALILAAFYAFIVWGIPVIKRVSVRKPKDVSSQILPPVEDALRIVFGTNEPFETKKAAGLYQTNHTFAIAVENSHPIRFISNCKLFLNIANEKDDGRKDYWLDGPFTLNPTERRCQLPRACDH